VPSNGGHDNYDGDRPSGLNDLHHANWRPTNVNDDGRYHYYWPRTRVLQRAVLHAHPA
jgi:hypothetical protein